MGEFSIYWYLTLANKYESRYAWIAPSCVLPSMGVASRIAGDVTALESTIELIADISRMNVIALLVVLSQTCMLS